MESGEKTDHTSLGKKKKDTSASANRMGHMQELVRCISLMLEKYYGYLIYHYFPVEGITGVFNLTSDNNLRLNSCFELFL